ncbi:hypothetical protein [Moraxella atlantae]|nr:hypothetical protein [Moraxella atlantae]
MQPIKCQKRITRAQDSSWQAQDFAVGYGQLSPQAGEFDHLG